MYDLHTHSLLSDGELLPVELIRRAAVLGYTTLGITDHVDASNISQVIEAVMRVKDSSRHYGVDLICGVEITHVPPEEIPALAREAKQEGAGLVIVHGETTVEPVAPGTNLAACTCADVDVLAHPGFITPEEAREAAKRDIALEITARRGHNRTNGHVMQVARLTGCRLVVDSDAHAPEDLMDENTRIVVGLGAGMTEEECGFVLSQNINEWLQNR